MSNCAIYIKGSDSIEQFIIDAVKTERGPGAVDIEGSNGKRTGVKLALFDLKWTTDTACPVYDDDGHQAGYDKTVSQLAADGENVSITIPDRATCRRAVKLRARIADLSEENVVRHVEKVFSGLPLAQIESLTILYLAVWGHIQMSNSRR